MAKKKKTSKKLKVQSGINKKENQNGSVGPKFALLLFGIGPIVLAVWFLLSKGFFEPL